MEEKNKIKIAGVHNYDTEKEEEYILECNIDDVREALEDPSIEKESFKSEYILDDTEFILDWLKQNNKEFKIL